MNRSVRFPDELEARIRARAVVLERSFNWVVVKTLEKALSEATEPLAGSRPTPAPVPSSEGVRSAAPSRASRKAPSLSDTWAR